MHNMTISLTDPFTNQLMPNRALHRIRLCRIGEFCIVPLRTYEIEGDELVVAGMKH